jgi:hypothetical protein
MKKHTILAALLLALTPYPAMPQVSLDKETSFTKPAVFYGGGLALGFGDVEYYEIWPLVGVNLTRRLGTGVRFLYRYRKDKRFSGNTYSTNDYGATLFARYHVARPFFLQAEYEYLSYEYASSFNPVTTDRDEFDSILAGGGIDQPLGGAASAYVVALYNFNYNDANSPYDTAWTFRFGLAIGF